MLFRSTGTNFGRPGFTEMMDLVEQGRVKTIIVKDHSRPGRNRLIVGALMERFTEDYNVRYIAVTDGIDSAKGLDDMVAGRELFNGFYPCDTSKKIRAVFTNKGNSGQRLCTQVPYGCIEPDKEQTQAVNMAQFIALVKKYNNIDILTPALVNEFIERIEVHAPDKSSGKRTQKIDIVYNFVGMLPVSLAKLKAA